MGSALKLLQIKALPRKRTQKSHFSLGILRIQNCDNNNGTDWVITKLSPIFKYTHANSCLPFFLKAE